MKTSHIGIQTKDNLTLPSLLFEPENKTSKVFVWLHGNGGSSVFYSVDKVRTYAKAFTDAGYALLAFNNRGAHQYHTIKVETPKLESQNSNDKAIPDRIRPACASRDDKKKEYRNAGTAFEVIKECVLDIDATLECLKNLGYLEFILVGHSTGANKICVYDHYKPDNQFSKYIILGGGDDTGIYYKMMGRFKFRYVLNKARKMVEMGKGEKLAPFWHMNNIYAYKGIFDILNPDGDYNCFPYNEYLNPKINLSTREHFDYFKRITKPSLVIYGEFDNYLPFSGKEAVNLLQKQIEGRANFTFDVIEGADHGFEDKHQELANKIVPWLNS